MASIKSLVLISLKNTLVVLLSSMKCAKRSLITVYSGISITVPLIMLFYTYLEGLWYDNLYAWWPLLANGLRAALGWLYYMSFFMMIAAHLNHKIQTLMPSDIIALDYALRMMGKVDEGPDSSYRAMQHLRTLPGISVSLGTITHLPQDGGLMVALPAAQIIPTTIIPYWQQHQDELFNASLPTARYAEVRMIRLNSIWPWLVFCNPAVMVLFRHSYFSSTIYVALLTLAYVKVMHDKLEITQDLLHTYMQIRPTTVATVVSNRILSVRANPQRILAGALVRQLRDAGAIV